jgi:hypothetical protein
LHGSGNAQVHPVVNLVHDFEPQSNLALGHLALFNVHSALRAATHATVRPVHPSASSPAHNWDTLTFPTDITSDDGLSGRSYPVGPPPISARMPDDVRSVAPSVLTDIDHELLHERGSALNDLDPPMLDRTPLASARG